MLRPDSLPLLLFFGDRSDAHHGQWRWDSLLREAGRRQPLGDVPELRRVHEAGVLDKLDEAYELLDFLRQPGAGLTFNLGALETLAVSYQKAGNHERALELFEHLLQEIPAAGEQIAFRKLVQKSERALQRSPSLLPERSFSIRGLFDSKSGRHAPWVRWAAFGTVVLFLFAVGMAGLNEYRRTHRTLQVVNAFAQPVTVSLDGGPPIPVSFGLLAETSRKEEQEVA